MEKRRKSATINWQNCVSSRATMIAVVKVWPKKDPPKSIPASDECAQIALDSLMENMAW